MRSTWSGTNLCNACIRNGAYGVKLLGAGHGGFVLALANESNLKRIKKYMKKYYMFPLKSSSTGTQIIYESE